MSQPDRGAGGDRTPPTLGYYQVLERLGSGATGVVYRARDRRSGITVALKVIHEHLQHDPAFVERFRREAQIAALLVSPYIVRVYEANTDQGRTYLVTEYVEGEKITDRLRDGPLPVPMALAAALQVALALQEAANRGVVHRDIKPDNILITRDNLIKVMDFGIARLDDASHLTMTGMFLGTVAYAAPEQFHGLADSRSDIYALGVTLFQMLAGEVPFRAPTATALMRLHEEAPPPLERLAGLPADVVTIVATCLAKRPGERYQQPSALARALEAALAVGEPSGDEDQNERTTIWRPEPESTPVTPAPLRAAPLVVWPPAPAVWPPAPAPVVPAEPVAAPTAPPIEATPAPVVVSRAVVAATVGVVEGDRLGPYRVGRLLRQDSLGLLHEAIDEATRRPVTLRIIVAGASTEAPALQAVDHPGIVRTLAIGRHRAGLYLVQEPTPGEPLPRLLDDGQAQGPSARIDATLAVASQIGSALTAMHKHELAHGCVNPDTIVVTEDGRALLTDAGLAGALDWRRVDGLAAGPYLAPEQRAGAVASGAADQYALAAVAQEMLLGRRANAASATDGAPPLPADALPSQIELVLRRAQTPEPALRYPSIVAFLGELVSALDEPTGAEPVEGANRRTAGPETAEPADIPPEDHRSRPSPRDSELPATETRLDAAPTARARSSPAVAAAATGGRRRWWVIAGAAVVTIGLAGLLWLAQPWRGVVPATPSASPIAAAPIATAAPPVPAAPAPTSAGAPVAATEPRPVTAAPTAGPNRPAAPPLASSLAITADGQLMATGSADGSVRLWATSDGSSVRTLSGHTDRVTSIAFAPDGQTLATGSADATARLWRVADGAALRALSGHGAGVTVVAFAPDGQTLATGSSDASVRLWRLSDGQVHRTLVKHADAVSSLAYSPDGLLLVSGGYDRAALVWRVRDGALVRVVDDLGSWVSSLAVAPDGQLVAMGVGDRVALLWSLGDGAVVQTLTGHTGPVLSVAFTPNGQTLVTGAVDRTVRLWRVADGAPVRTLTGHTGSVFGVAVTPNGSAVVSVGDQSARQWRMTDGALLRSTSVLGGATSSLSSKASAAVATTATPGTVSVSAAGFLARERLAIWLTGPSHQILTIDPRLTDERGGVTFPLRLPRHLQPGRWIATLHGLDSDWSATSALEMPELGPNGTLDVQPAVARPGTTYRIRSGGYQPGERVAYWLTDPENATVSGDVVLASADGLVEFSFSTPPAARPGQWRVSIYGLQSDRLAIGVLGVE